MAVTNRTPFDFPPHSWTNEYHVVLRNASRFDRLLCKEDFLDEGVTQIHAPRSMARTVKRSSRL
jgi:hypothetical protein